MDAAALSGGFSDAPIDGAEAFRVLLSVLARPGEIGTLAVATPPAPLSRAAGSLLLTLADQTTPVHLASSHDNQTVRDWITFHCGAPLVSAPQAAFAVGSWAALKPLDRFALGDPAYPDRSATLVVELAELQPRGAILTGPGIKKTARLGLPETAAFQENAARFPLGWDAYFTASDEIAGLPRTTKVTEEVI